jgi:uncharacterized membrane protein
MARLQSGGAMQGQWPRRDVRQSQRALVAGLRLVPEERMTRFILAYLTTTLVFFSLDFIWLSTATSRFYRPMLGNLLLEKPGLAVAGLFYLVYVVGVVVFAVTPAINAGSWTTALLQGALLGLIAYGTYDFTNLATIKGWPAIVTIVDLAWGTVATALSATLGYLITRKLSGE